MHAFVNELASFKTCRSRATWAWLLGAVSFCLGAFAFYFGAPLGIAIAVIVLSCSGVVAWAAAGTPIGIVSSSAKERVVWAAVALAAVILGALFVFYTSSSGRGT